MKKELEKFFSDQEYAGELLKELESTNANPLKRGLIDKIISGTKPDILIDDLFTKAKKHDFAVDMELADMFFLISELNETTQSQSDFAIDMSIFLSEDMDSRDSKFNPEVEYSELMK